MIAQRGAIKITSAVLLFLIGGVVAGANPTTVIRNSHQSGVSVIQVTGQEDQTLVTGGDDGKLMFWDLPTQRLVQSIRVGRYPVQDISFYPDGQRVAVLSSDGRRQFRITVWNWNTGERLFRHVPDGDVLHMEVSPGGRFIFYSTTDRASMRVLNADTGQARALLQQNTGIISWFVPAASEERIMLYSPANGTIEYRNVSSGDIAASFQAPPGLEHLTLLEQRRFAAGRNREGQLAVVDLLSGAVMATLPMGPIEDIHLIPNTSDFAVVTRDRTGPPAVHRLRFENGRITRRFSQSQAISENAAAFLQTDRELIGALTDGRLFRWSSLSPGGAVFAEPVVLPIADINLHHDTIQLLTANEIISISRDVLDNFDRVQYRSMPLQAAPTAQFLAPGSDSALIWNRLPGGMDPVVQLDSPALQVTALPFELPQQPIHMSATDRAILTITRAGEVRKWDRDTGETTFSYRSTGIQTALYTDNQVFIGKSFRGGILDSSILLIDPRSGETVPLTSDADIVFSLSFDPRRGRLFAIGIRTDANGRPATILEVHEGVGFQRRRVILELPGEYLDAIVAVDYPSGTIYTTLDDRGGILRWDGARIVALDRDLAHIPRRLFLTPEYVIALNNDGTVTALSRRTGQVQVKVGVIDSGTSGSWIAVRHDGAVYTTHDFLRSPRFISEW